MSTLITAAVVLALIVLATYHIAICSQRSLPLHLRSLKGTSNATNVCLHFSPLDSPCLRADNVVEGTHYPRRCHHSLFHLIEAKGTKFDLAPGTIREETGLIVPWEYDCSTWNLSGIYEYHAGWVPSRSVRCAQKAISDMGFKTVTVPLPLIDEEYFETIAVYQAALRAKGSFHAVEMGARWGTWGSRAVALLQAFNPMPYSVLYYEPSATADGLIRVHELNGFNNYTLIRANADHATFIQWSRTVPHIDVVDMDIQSYEATIIPEIIDVLREKVLRLIIGTHGVDTHYLIKEMLTAVGFLLVHETAHHQDYPCLKGDFRDRKDYPAVLLNTKCYFNSSYGAIVPGDGELVFDNPKVSERGKSNACFLN
jgi:hypothetical protein